MTIVAGNEVRKLPFRNKQIVPAVDIVPSAGAELLVGKHHIRVGLAQTLLQRMSFNVLSLVDFHHLSLIHI